MRISATQYAQTLYDLVEGKTAAQAKTVIGKYASLLLANRDTKKLSAIILKFIKIWNATRGEASVEISSAHVIDSATRALFTSYIKKLTQAKELDLKQTEDKSLIGGVIIRYGDKVLDASLKYKISDLKNILSK